MNSFKTNIYAKFNSLKFKITYYLKNNKNKFIPDKMLNSINKRITSINYNNSSDNLYLSIKISLFLVLASLLYLLLSLMLFHAVWYHILFSLVSTSIFYYLVRETIFERMEYKLKHDLPRSCNKLSHYYEHYNYNLSLALKDATKNVSKVSRPIFVRFSNILDKPNYDVNMTKLQDIISSNWLKTLSNFLVIAKNYSGKVISDNLERIVDILDYLNIQQGFNNAELVSMEIFVFFAPYIIIPASQFYNKALLADININNMYAGIEAQSLTAIIFLISNVGALFIHWIRKLQN